MQLLSEIRIARCHAVANTRSCASEEQVGQVSIKAFPLSGPVTISMVFKPGRRLPNRTLAHERIWSFDFGEDQAIAVEGREVGGTNRRPRSRQGTVR